MLKKRKVVNIAEQIAGDIHVIQHPVQKNNCEIKEIPGNT
jgi:hypothetical protein